MMGMGEKGPQGDVKEPRTAGMDLVGRIDGALIIQCEVGLCEWRGVYRGGRSGRSAAQRELHWHIKNTHGVDVDEVVREDVGESLKYFL